MRVVKSFQDVNIVVKQLQDQIDLLLTKNIDLGKRRIVNAAAAVNDNDYVIKSQLPTIPAFPKAKTQHYSIVFNPPASEGTTIVPAFIVDPSRAGYPIACKVSAEGVGTTDFTGNFQINGTNLLENDIKLPAGSSGPVSSSEFKQPLVKLVEDMKVTCTITALGGCSLLTMQIYVRVIQTDETQR